MIRPLNTGWHVLYVKSRHEKKVHHNLLEKKLESYLPLVEKERIWSDRRKKVSMPLFKSYVFVNIKNAFDFHNVRTVNGAYDYISFGNTYAIVKDEEIEKIKFFTETEGIKDIEIKDCSFSQGESKIINKGPLTGLKCEILKVKDKNQVTVRLGTLKQNLVATIPSQHLSEPN